MEEVWGAPDHLKEGTEDVLGARFREKGYNAFQTPTNNPFVSDMLKRGGVAGMGKF